MRTVFNCLWSFVPYAAVKAAIQLELFDHMSQTKGRSLEYLSKVSGADVEGMVAVLRVLRSENLVRVRDKKWYLCPEADTFLSKGSRLSLVAFFEWEEVLYNDYMKLAGILRGESEGESRTLYAQAFGLDAGRSGEFAEIMWRIGYIVAYSCVPYLDLGGCSLLDVGSGTGAFTQVFRSQWPELSVVMVDYPEVLEHLSNELRGSGRVSLREGDWWTSLPVERFDAVLLSQVLHEEVPCKARALFEGASERLKVGGRLLVVGFDSAGGRREIGARAGLNVYVERGARTYDLAELTEWADACNLQVVGVHQVAGGRTLSIFGRK